MAAKIRTGFWYVFILVGSALLWASGISGALILFAYMMLGSVAAIIEELIHPKSLRWSWGLAAWIAIMFVLDIGTHSITGGGGIAVPLLAYFAVRSLASSSENRPTTKPITNLTDLAQSIEPNQRAS